VLGTDLPLSPLAAATSVPPAVSRDTTARIALAGMLAILIAAVM
jgi:hypothetical protein